MDVNAIDLQAPSERATNLGGRAPDLGEHASDQGARGKVSRARAVLSFLRAKTLAAANAASQSGLMVAGGRRRGVIERTVPSRAYVRWTMFDQTFIGTGSRPGGFHGVGGARRRAWVLSPARVIVLVLIGFRRDWIRLRKTHPLMLTQSRSEQKRPMRGVRCLPWIEPPPSARAYPRLRPLTATPHTQMEVFNTENPERLRGPPCELVAGRLRP